VIVTRIASRKNNQRLFAVYIDGEFAFDASDSTILKFGLRSNISIDEETIAAVKSAEVQREAQLTAVNYVSYRPRSSREVLDHLKKKGFSRELADSIIHHFESVSLINNLEFARMFVRDKLRRKPTGRALLRRQLAAKGIPSPMIEQVLREYISDEDQKNAAKELASRRLRLTKRSLSGLDLLKQKQRLTGYLLRHGFSSEIVQKTIQALFRQ
jgi:regulatory protein